MPININEAIQKIKQAGSACVRAVPMPNQNVLTGDYQIEIKTGDIWSPIVIGVSKKIAEDIITQATSRLLLG
jgi:hypothetical protein